ncbi:MAG TPA: hypothetical protein VLL94_04650, partial [Nitrospiraceae bacterium]|nr:hypothetical protein [Nitrospiraceae bacterium]
MILFIPIALLLEVQLFVNREAHRLHARRVIDDLSLSNILRYYSGIVVNTVALPPPPVGGPYTVVLDGPQRVELRDVLVGDVWLCGGQSNMGVGLKQARNG